MIKKIKQKEKVTVRMKNKYLKTTLCTLSMIGVFLVIAGCSNSDEVVYKKVESMLKKAKNYTADFKVYKGNFLKEEGKWIAMGKFYKVEGKTYKKDKVIDSMYLKKGDEIFFWEKNTDLVIKIKSVDSWKKPMKKREDLKYIGKSVVNDTETFVFQSPKNPEFSTPFFKLSDDMKIYYGQKDGIIRKLESGEFKIVYDNITINDENITEDTFSLPVSRNIRIVELSGELFK